MASSLTRNQVPRKGLGVRVPCPPLVHVATCHANPLQSRGFCLTRSETLSATKCQIVTAKTSQSQNVVHAVVQTDMPLRCFVNTLPLLFAPRPSGLWINTVVRHPFLHDQSAVVFQGEIDEPDELLITKSFTVFGFKMQAAIQQ